MDNLLNVPPLEGANAPQGLLAPKIFVQADNVDNDEGLVQAVVDFVNIVRERAFLTPGEYPEEANWSYCADYYLAQVNNGGHGQFAHNSEMLPRALRDCRLGLQAMGALEYLKIFDEFLVIMAREDERAAAIAKGSGFGEIDSAIRDLDTRFFALGDMINRNAAWLRTLPQLHVLPAKELEATFEGLANTNPLRDVRKQEAARTRAEFESQDATYSAAHACAAYEGGVFERLTAGTPIGPNGEIGILWGAVTSKGFRWLKIINGSHAEWRDDKQGLKGIYYYATASKYPAPVGAGDFRSAILASAKGRGATPDEMGQFYLGAVVRASAALAPDNQSAAALILGASAAKNLQRFPRSVWRSFAPSREHATLRLTLAYTLWDQTVMTVRRAHAQVLDTDYMATALMAAGGALAAAGATALRLLEGRHIVALDAVSPSDLLREQHNVMEQLREIADWSRAMLFSLASEAQSTKLTDSIFLRPSALRFARTLLLHPDHAAAENLARRMMFFDDEYPAAKVKPADLTTVIRRVLAAFESTPDDYNLLHAARAFERVQTTGSAPANWQALVRVAPPAQAKVASKAPLVAGVSVFDSITQAPEGGVAVEYDARGWRRTISK